MADDGAEVAAQGPLSPKSSAEEERKVFLELVTDEEGYKIFLAFLKNKYTEQHLLFWKAAEDYAKFCSVNNNGEANFHKIEEKAETVYNMYIKVGTRQQINITETVKNEIAQRIDEGLAENSDEPVANLFDVAKGKCVELLRGNFFHEFRNEKKFSEWKNKKDGNGEEAASPRAATLKRQSTQTSNIDKKGSEKKGKSGSCTIL